jgi:predicted FMN-binding regulatory protein PaiB
LPNLPQFRDALPSMDPSENLMYLPAHFNEDRLEVLHELIRQRPLATLVTLAADGLNAHHIPFADFIDKQLGAIVGIEIAVTRFLGKWKTSQNQSPDDRQGVVKGLAERTEPDSR